MHIIGTQQRDCLRRGMMMLTLVLLGASCVHPHEPALQALVNDGLLATMQPFEGDAQEPATPEGRLADYQTIALGNHPSLRAQFERFRHSVHLIAASRSLPEPKVTFGVFVDTMSALHGSEKARLKLEQEVPWFGSLNSALAAAVANSEVERRTLEAQAVHLRSRVGRSYWNLWEVRATRVLHDEHRNVLQQVAEAARARVSTGVTTLAELQLIELEIVKIIDILDGMSEAELRAEAQLAETLGYPERRHFSTIDEPGRPALPKRDDEALRSLALKHPAVQTLVALRGVAEAEVDGAHSRRYPSFVIGGEWMWMEHALGDELMRDDAFMMALGVRVPLWQGIYSERIHAAEAQLHAREADHQAMVHRVGLKVTEAHSKVRDAFRRVQVYQHTLVPQSEAVHASVLGAYTVGRGSVAETLLAHRDLLELKVELESARASFERAWLELEDVAGTRLEQQMPTQRGVSNDG